MVHEIFIFRTKLQTGDLFRKWYEATGQFLKKNAVFNFMKAALSEIEFEQLSLTQMRKSSYGNLSQL